MTQKRHRQSCIKQLQAEWTSVPPAINRSLRQYDPGAEAAGRPVAKDKFAALRLHNRLRDRQTDADAAGLAASQLFEALFVR